jgi:hypothetical protein
MQIVATSSHSLFQATGSSQVFPPFHFLSPDNEILTHNLQIFLPHWVGKLLFHALLKFFPVYAEWHVFRCTFALPNSLGNSFRKTQNQ